MNWLIAIGSILLYIVIGGFAGKIHMAFYCREWEERDRRTSEFEKDEALIGSAVIGIFWPIALLGAVVVGAFAGLAWLFRPKAFLENEKREKEAANLRKHRKSMRDSVNMLDPQEDADLISQLRAAIKTLDKEIAELEERIW